MISLCASLAGCIGAPLEIYPKFHLTPLLRHIPSCSSYHYHHSFVVMSLASISAPYPAGPVRLQSMPSFKSLSLSGSDTLQRSLVHHPPIAVDNCANCPNIHCTVNAPHTYYFDVVEPCPEGMPLLFLRRFHPDFNPFPNDNRYDIIEAPTTLLEHGCQAYVVGYGVVRLLEIAVKVTKRSKDWKVFQCIQGGEIIVAELAVRKEWCKIPERHMGFCGVSFSFFHFS